MSLVTVSNLFSNFTNMKMPNWEFRKTSVASMYIVSIYFLEINGRLAAQHKHKI